MLTGGAATLGDVTATRAAAAIAAAALLLSACGGRGGEGGEGGAGASSFNTPFAREQAYPVFASSELVVGRNRFLVGVRDRNDAPVAGPDLLVTIAFFDLAESETEPVATSDMDYIDIGGGRGLYVTTATFTSPGTWGAEVEMIGRGINETARGSFEVAEDESTPALGAPVPAVDTPTADDVAKLSDISTDPDPNPRFYEVSIADAVDAGEPFVVAFATPRFCTSDVCGPALDVVDGVARRFPGTTFIHVEPYDLDEVPDLVPVEAVERWGLPTEPWVFAVDRRGRVAAKFEGALSHDELRAAVRKLR